MFGTKKKLMAAVVMLVISAIMLTSASYAWFTISTNPEIKGMTTQVVVNENLEIALASTDVSTIPGTTAQGDTGKQYTWGNIIDLTPTGTVGAQPETAYAALVKTLRPVTLNTTLDPDVFQYPTYGADGRPNADLSNLSDSPMANGFGNLTDGTKAYGYYVDFWVRSNVGGDLKLNTTGVTRSAEGTLGLGSYFESNGQTGPDKVLATNLFVAFKDITPDIDGATEAVGTHPVAVTHTAGTPGDAIDGKYKTTFESGTIVNLTPNSAKLIRMYVYLEGANITNESASIDGALVGGKLNVQFGIAGVTRSMDGED
jgi:hypothetical protein